MAAEGASAAVVSNAGLPQCHAPSQIEAMAHDSAEEDLCSEGLHAGEQLSVAKGEQLNTLGMPRSRMRSLLPC